MTSTPLRHIATDPALLSSSCPAESNSDSEVSGGGGTAASVSVHSDGPPSVMKAPSSLPLASADPAPSGRKNRRTRHRSSEWEILEGLRDGQRCEERPDKFEGYLMKRRKWPLQGWHKRFFCLEKGLLTYSKSSTEMAKGKIHGFIDVGLSVITTKSKRRRIDIDADEYIYHLKVKSKLLFQQWVAQLRHHRLYRQHEIAFGSKEAPKITSPVEDVQVFPCSPILSSTTAPPSVAAVRQSVRHIRSPLGHQNRVAAWILDSSAIDQGNKEIGILQEKLFQLNNILLHFDANSSSSHLELPGYDGTGTGSLKKERRRFHLKKKKPKTATVPNATVQSLAGSGRKCSSQSQGVEIVVSKESIIENVNHVSSCSAGDDIKSAPIGGGPQLMLPAMAHLSCSHPTLLQGDDSAPDSASLASCPTPTTFRQHEEFVTLAREIHSGLKNILRSLQTERERLKQTLECDTYASSSALITSLKNSLNQALQQNQDLRSRLGQIHHLSDFPYPASPTDNVDEPTLVHQPLHSTLSHESSSVLSASEYFDAAENLSDTSSSSEASASDGEESFLSDGSEEGTEYTPIPSVTEEELMASNNMACATGRRNKLPVPKPDSGDFSLWNMLYKNIGKDLSKVSMPVTINEPLNVLQRLCEELEYSELLDKAAETPDPYERMVYIAAFAVSGYSSSYHRAGHKPFNPLLGETYECIREDRGFRFIAEQVSHHPPISACYCESRNFVFWQDMRIKTKFWGKSMEIIPIGTVNVMLPGTADHYQWNKVTTCVHNLFTGPRWVDQYGEMNITDSTGDITCKLTFVKASYWSNKRYEVHGTVNTKQGDVIHHLFGKWTEGLLCGKPSTARCIWRPGAMAEDYEMYYGFTRFAIELNEIDPDMAKLLPPTDTRFRPDQRLLEEGNITMAENIKQQLEQSQRERRKQREEQGISYTPMWFRKEVSPDGKEEWVYTHKYWETRANPGFVNVNFPEKLW